MSELPPLRDAMDAPADNLAVLTGDIEIILGWLKVTGVRLEITPAFLADASRLLRAQQAALTPTP